MSTTIKELTFTYDLVNKTNTFTNGDVIQGQVFLEVAKEVEIKRFFIKLKGDAKVMWTEFEQEQSRTYISQERYFKLKQFFIQDPSKPEEHNQTEETYDNVVGPGKYVFPFSLRIPHGDIPPSFKAFHGSVKYALEARLDRSWKTKCTAYREINFVPRIDVDDHLMGLLKEKLQSKRPQSAATDKKMRLFTSGSASFEATIDKMGYMQGEVIRVSTYVDNSSSRELKLKCSLEQKQAFYAQDRSKNSSYIIFKVVEDPIPSGSSQTIITDLRIPSNLQVTIRSSSIIKLEYVLKVYLDVPYAKDPKVKFPVTILPALDH